MNSSTTPAPSGTAVMHGAYEISADPARIDAARVHHWLSSDAYWALGRPREKQDAAIAGSLNFGAYHGETGAMAAYARIVTDYATFAWLCDVYVDPGPAAPASAPRSSPPSATTSRRTDCAASCSPPPTRTVCTRRSVSRHCRIRTSGWLSGSSDPAALRSREMTP